MIKRALIFFGLVLVMFVFQGIVMFVIKDEYTEWVTYAYITNVVFLIMLATGSTALVLVKNQ
jgi:hypothetical protein